MREVLVLVENLTDEDFQLLGSFVEDVETRAVVEPAFRRCVKLRWQSPWGRNAAAVAYGSMGPVQDNQASEGVALKQKLLVISVAMQARQGVGGFLSTFGPGVAPAGARFFASFTTCPIGRRQQGDLRSQLAESAALADGASEGCEWIVVRREEQVVEVRLRVLPPEGAIVSPESSLPEEDSGDVAEELSADEAEVRRLAGYREVFRALNRQAQTFEAEAEQDAMDLDRLRRLPEKARIDFVLTLLAVLCRRRTLTLSRFAATTRANEDAHMDEIALLDAALTKHIHHVYAAVVPLVGFSEEQTMRQVIGLAGRHLQPAGEEQPCELKVPALISAVCDAAERAAVEALAERASAEAAAASGELADGGKAEPEPAGDMELLPSSASASASNSSAASSSEQGTPGEIESKLASQAAPAKAEPAAAWSVQQAWQLGREDEIVRFLGAVRLLDMDLVSTVSGAVDGLNNGRLVCPEACCIVASRSDSSEHCFVALYRAQMEDKALALLGVSSTSDLSASQPLERLEPNEIPLRSVNSFCRGTSSAADATVCDKEEGTDPTFFPRATGSSLPRGWLVARELLAVVLGAGSGVFDARSRAALFDLCAGFGVLPRLLCRWEAEIGGALFEAMETEHVVEQQNQTRKNWNRGKVAAAAVGGGLLLAVTGGLAAPAIAGGITAVGGAAATAGAAVGLSHAGLMVGGAIAGMGAALASLGTGGAIILFGVSGAGLTGWKMSRRWGLLQEFAFVPLARNTVKKAVTIDLPASDARAVMRLDEATEAGDGVVQEDVVVTTVGGRDVAVIRGSVLHRRECLAGILSPVSPSNSTNSNSPTRTHADVVRFHFLREVDVAQRAVHLAIFVTGWLENEEDFTQPWADVARLFFPSSGHLAIRWETDQLMRLGQMFAEMVTTQVASGAANMWIRSTAGVAIASSGLAAMVVAWPVSIISAMSNLDNAWLVVTERARLAGKCLAHVLADRQSVGQRPVSLVGHSLGARMIFYCLQELHDMGEYHAVDDVILLGAPVSTNQAKWQKVRSVASGRIINGYLKSDWVLAFFYRYMEWGLSVAGLSEVNVPGIESVNLAGLGISGHSDYPHHIADIFSKMRVGERDLHWRKDVMAVPETPARPRLRTLGSTVAHHMEVSAYQW